MTVLKHELSRGRLSLLIWTASIAFMLAVCILIFPQMKEQMNLMNDMIKNMGGISSAFGMNGTNFANITEYYGVEASEMLGIGGGIFAALLGSALLSKEQSGGTAEFLFSHPISRKSVVLQKLVSMVVSIVFLNVVCATLSVLSMVVIGEDINLKLFVLLSLAYTFLQLEIGFICFAFSAFIKKGGIAVGIGFTMLLYFINIVSSLSEDAEWLKYFTPFSYVNSSLITKNMSLDGILLIIGACASIVSIFIAFYYYSRKDMN